MISNTNINIEILKLFALNKRQFGQVGQIIIETRWTDFLQSLVEFGNSNLLQNFQYRLEMEVGRQK
jgi:hypothetical protein